MSNAHFKPPWWLRNPHLQTIAGTLFPSPPVAFRRQRWTTPDGDFVDVDFVDGPEGSPWVHLYHGLEGSSNSPYARNLMCLVRQRGWRGSVFHFRGCSGEPNRLPRFYHSGDSKEIDWSLRRIHDLARGASVYAAGVSLGANALARWLGEQREAACEVVTAAAVVSAPVVLLASGEALSHGIGRLYSLFFLRLLKPNALARLERYPGLFDAAKCRRASTLRGFDDVVTGPVHGFTGVVDYYTQSAAKQYLMGVRVPTLLLNAKDDPFLPGRELPTKLEVSAAVKREFPKHGGHVGFVSGPFPGNTQWLPQRLLHFFEHRQ